MRGPLATLAVAGPGGNAPRPEPGAARAANNPPDRDHPQPRRPHSRDAVQGLGGATLGKALVGHNPLPGGAPLAVRATPAREGAARERGAGPHGGAAGSEELACGGQAFIATSLFDPSMSALPIIAKQNSPSVGLFTH